MTKRGPDDLQLSLRNGVGGASTTAPGVAAAAYYANVMTADSEPKKAKLDPTLYSSQFYTPAMHHGLMTADASTVAAVTAAANATTAQLLTGNPITQIQGIQLSTLPQCNSTSAVTSIPVSKVVHVRNIPPDLVDVELMQLCIQYGPVSNYMMLKGKSQAFVEYEEEASAAAFVSGMTAVPIQIRGRTLFAQYSTHRELKFDKNKAISDTESVANGSVSNFEVGTQQQPNSVLRTIIENMMFPVSLDVLYQLFTRYGKVLRIITFNKNNTFQALVQMSEANSAQLAKQGLENQNVYNGCCTLRIDYSKLSTLNVKYNNDKSRDYTNPNLPAGEMTLEQTIAMSIPGLQNLIPANPYNFAFGANPATTFLTTQLAASTAAAAAVNDSANAAALAPYLNPLGLTSANLAPSISSMRFPMINLTPVILVSNLHEMKVTTDALFTLFGVYGDVMRVKILYNKKDNALIQYSEPQQAQLALTHLDKVKWHDRLIRVAPSKHTNVQMPKEGQPDAGLTRDYAHSTLHRFKKPGSKNYLNIYPPCATLHLSNIPTSVSEEKLKEMFAEAGFAVKAFKFFPKDHKMALCQLEDIETAIDALIAMHNHKLAENAHLRVSFSKSGI
ncbi:RRM domain-containing protein [Caenorhabditis elegans]|uniref:Putative RNA-binding protein PTB-1a n=1 Tax=Caenorhabditis elegans TaxID=6239 RepID=Q18999_CAEEL|nr:RRM domain-containing protein [Caenorhabditis elegans]BAU45385.1 putative RNA-binding protein PTB-1a [Caenorhabditis elegans]CAA85411.3 RRM domain-containing protein [Caenorhabditis elegans]|eukprot:NP_741041.1 human PTB (hnRNP) homolog [Caenorhabditis elegans]